MDDESTVSCTLLLYLILAHLLAETHFFSLALEVAVMKLHYTFFQCYQHHLILCSFRLVGIIYANATSQLVHQECLEHHRPVMVTVPIFCLCKIASHVEHFLFPLKD